MITELSKLSILEKTLAEGCSMAIVTTMQDKKIIEEKRSYLFYKNERLVKYVGPFPLTIWPPPR